MSSRGFIQFASLMLLVLLAGCGRSSSYMPYGVQEYDLSDELRRTVLVIGVDPDAAPMSFHDGGQTRGVEADFGRMLAEALGLRPVFVAHPFADLQGELGGGQIDIIMAGMSVTPARHRRFAFCEPYVHVGQQALVRRADAERFNDSQAILDTRAIVAVEHGTTGSFFANEHLRHADVYEFPSLYDAVAALRAGKVDVVIHDSVSIMWEARRYSDRLMTVPGLLTDEPLAWALRRTDTQRREKINALVRQWQADGTIDRVLREWLDPSAYTTPMLLAPTAAEE